jgi:predicted AAA+ superfamily ATPase
MLGQLTDAGSTTTLAHYLDLLETAFLASGLEAYTKDKLRRRGSSPKLILWNNALINASSRQSYEQVQNDGDPPTNGLHNGDYFLSSFLVPTSFSNAD